MTARIADFLATPFFSASLVLWLSSCMQMGAQQHGDADASYVTGVARQRSSARRIAQVLIEGRPTYAVCEEPACPVVTPKVFASELTSRVDAEVEPVQGDVHTGLDVGANSALKRKAEAHVLEGPVDGASTSSEIARHASLAPTPPSPNFMDRETAVNFALNSAVLTSQAKDLLDRAMPLARRSDRIVISGRTDNRGGEGFNQRLAFARALAVRDYIRDQSPTINNVISIDARGACCFVASNATPEGRHRNRRVEVVFRGTRSQEAS